VKEEEMKRLIASLLMIIALMMIVVSCAAPAATPTPVPTATKAPVATVAPAATATPVLPTPAQTSAGQLVRSEKQRVTKPSATETDLTKLTSGNSAFAFDLYQALRQKPGNLFYSPYSISLALAMTYAGARSETATQMANTLHFTLSPDSLHPAFNSLDLELASRGEGAKGKDEKGFRLNIVNAIWGQDGYKFLPAFLDVLAENYGAGLRLLDFVKAPEESRLTINNWVSDQTEGKIKDLIPQGEIDPLTRLVLTNAIYFNAAWRLPLSKDRTADGLFYLLDGSKVTVPMMQQTESLRYAEGQGYQAVELPYDGQQLAMVILLPGAGQLAAFEGSLNAEQVEAIVRGLAPRQVALTMPRFKYDSSFKLNETLRAMGMADAFKRGVADFSGMDGTHDLFIGAVMHKAFVSVDEAGTEAAAATAVIMQLKSSPALPVQVTVDRPFVFLIRDLETGTILFVGRVVNPGA
jgi:serpin B